MQIWGQGAGSTPLCPGLSAPPSRAELGTAHRAHLAVQPPPAPLGSGLKHYTPAAWSRRPILARSCEPDRPRLAWSEKEFSFSNSDFWFCVSTLRNSGASRPHMDSQQVAGTSSEPPSLI
ncbi:uncharacterized protein LOC115831488 [Nomascus leucogenys]|uniref:uncharacterized protein LOC115831488 n=1 Tax=Nomascus leucogenys TaxID=61853 RepID=UPI00122DA6D2|nr:uncharacterized protein LOC115831488 [Nomascus leucogenys]